MKAIDDYINGNLSDAKSRARKAGRRAVTNALLEQYGYSDRQTRLVEWLNTHTHVLPIRLRVAPAAKSLHHPSGMPMLSREFVITAAEKEEATP